VETGWYIIVKFSIEYQINHLTPHSLFYYYLLPFLWMPVFFYINIFAAERKNGTGKNLWHVPDDKVILP
jgi:hypothetical protein